MKRFWALVLCTLLAGCGSKCPDEMAGNSAGCGNPVKIAELQTVDVNCPDCQGGIFEPTNFSIQIGKTFIIELDTQFISQADSVWGWIYLFHGLQNPVFDSLPLDSFPLIIGKNGFQPGDFQKAREVSPDSGSRLFRFSMQVKLRIRVKTLIFEQDALLAGLGLDWVFGEFICSDKNPLLAPGETQALHEPMGKFEGILQSRDSLLLQAESAYVYVPGSPYHTAIKVTNGYFLLEGLPNARSFELRVFAIPSHRPTDGKVPVYFLQADNGSGSDRPFRALISPDSLLLPVATP